MKRGRTARGGRQIWASGRARIIHVRTGREGVILPEAASSSGPFSHERKRKRPNPLACLGQLGNEADDAAPNDPARAMKSKRRPAQGIHQFPLLSLPLLSINCGRPLSALRCAQCAMGVASKHIWTAPVHAYHMCAQTDLIGKKFLVR
jgi:hypothetical protein